MVERYVIVPLYEDPFYSYAISFEGESYTLEFQYNERAKLYFLSIYTADREPVVLGVINDIADGNMSGARDKATAAVRGYVNTITAPGRTGFNTVVGGGRDYLNETFGLNLADPRLAPFGGYDPAQATARYRSSEKQAGQGAMNQYSLPGINQPLAQGQRAIDLKIDMSVDIQAASPEEFNDKFQQQFQSIIREGCSQW